MALNGADIFRPRADDPPERLHLDRLFDCNSIMSLIASPKFTSAKIIAPAIALSYSLVRAVPLVDRPMQKPHLQGHPKPDEPEPKRV
jgi:hypothetical protein